MPTIKRSAEAVWNGGGPDGNGTLTTDSGALKETPYSAGRRFGDDPGTNPEELVAAAHAGCFNMALAFGLTGAGKTPEELRTTAVVSIEKEDAGWTVKTSELTLKGKVPGMSADEFKQAAEGAKAGCPISRLLAGAEITLDAELVS
jgi:osmotically inducible protein OsmC